MSVSGICSNSNTNSQINPQYRLTSGEFQQLGQDLASGNLSSAQSDFATLQQSLGATGGATGSTTTASTASATSASNSLTQTLQQLSSDLQSGNISGAQKDYSTLQMSFRSPINGHGYHHHGISGGPSGPIQSLFNDASQSSTGGTTASNTTEVQQAFATLAQQLRQYSLGSAGSTSSLNSLLNPISLMA
jgi:hypothetical protein